MPHNAAQHTPRQERTTQQVFQDHLEKRAQGRIDEDIAMNFADDVILLTGIDIYYGHKGVRSAVHNLDYYLPQARFTYRTTRVADEYAFLEWSGESPEGHVQDGADSFVIRNGKIIAQTIHYTVK